MVKKVSEKQLKEIEEQTRESDKAIADTETALIGEHNEVHEESLQALCVRMSDSEYKAMVLELLIQIRDGKNV